MKIFKNYIILFISVFLFSCTEEVIHLDLETAEPRLVIDASIDWIKNTSGNEQKIKLTKTTAYYDDVTPTVSGANVTITNSTTTFHFIENSNTGEYICQNFEPVIGETYSLTISLDGEVYTATETLLGVPTIMDSINQNDKGGMGGNEIEITYYYQDNASEQNNYLYSVKNPRVAFPQYEVENDENTQGSLVPVYYSNEDLEIGDLLTIKLYGISKNYHDYFRKLLIASGADMGPFPTIPVSVRGNIINQTNSKNFAYGYFRLSEVDVKEYIIK